MDMEGLMAAEREIRDRKLAEGLAELEGLLQAAADALPAVGSDGQALKRVRRIGMAVDTSMGTAKLEVAMGYCKTSKT